MNSTYAAGKDADPDLLVANVQDRYANDLPCYKSILEAVENLTGASSIDEFREVLEQRDEAIMVCDSRQRCGQKHFCPFSSSISLWSWEKKSWAERNRA